jgi:hypothetical protein
MAVVCVRPVHGMRWYVIWNGDMKLAILRLSDYLYVDYVGSVDVGIFTTVLRDVTLNIVQEWTKSEM